MREPTAYGYRVVGSLAGRRRLVDAASALAGYASCDARADLHTEGYLSAFTFGPEFAAHLRDTGSTRDYAGSCGARWLWLDVDSHDLDEALHGARRLAGTILDRYRSLDGDDLLLFFSGAKGFHAGVPLTWRPAPSVTFHRVARRFAERLADFAGVRIDSGVYDRVRAFRAPNSRHPASGLYKRRLAVEELTGLPMGRILELAREPAPFALPWPKAIDLGGAKDWRSAETEACRQAEEKERRRAVAAAGTPALNRLTLEFIRSGAGQGERHRLLFSAAANLAEFGCPDALAHALLSEAALDSGLPPSEVRRQIDCGLRHRRGGAGDA
jgi:hypothetical protein